MCPHVQEIRRVASTSRLVAAGPVRALNPLYQSQLRSLAPKSGLPMQGGKNMKCSPTWLLHCSPWLIPFTGRRARSRSRAANLCGGGMDENLGQGVGPWHCPVPVSEAEAAAGKLGAPGALSPFELLPQPKLPAPPQPSLTPLPPLDGCRDAASTSPSCGEERAGASKRRAASAARGDSAIAGSGSSRNSDPRLPALPRCLPAGGCAITTVRHVAKVRVLPQRVVERPAHPPPRLIRLTAPPVCPALQPLRGTAPSWCTARAATWCCPSRWVLPKQVARLERGGASLGHHLPTECASSPSTHQPPSRRRGGTAARGRLRPAQLQPPQPQQQRLPQQK